MCELTACLVLALREQFREGVREWCGIVFPDFEWFGGEPGIDILSYFFWETLVLFQFFGGTLQSSGSSRHKELIEQCDTMEVRASRHCIYF